MTSKQEKAFERMIEKNENGHWLNDAVEYGARLAAPAETAIELLWERNFFPLLLADMAKAGLVNERRNALATYIFATSRLREAPFNEIVKGSSSAGKNFLLRTVLKFIPEEDVLSASSLSEHALDYAEEGSLAHKIVLIDEHGGTNHPLRQLMSEGRLIRWVSVMENGKRVMKKREVRGPICGMTTTTESALAIDDENRNFSIWMNESYAQTQAITIAMATPNSEKLSPGRIRCWHQVQKMIARYARVPIEIPRWLPQVAKQMLPYGDIRIRRYWGAFLGACKVVCMIRSAKHIERPERLFVDYEDFAVTLCIFDKIIANSLTRSSRDPELATASLVDLLVERGCRGGVTASDLMGFGHIRSIDQAYRALRKAKNAGPIYVVSEAEKNNEKRYLRSPESTFLGSPEVILNNIGLKVSGSYVHPITGRVVYYGTPEFPRYSSIDDENDYYDEDAEADAKDDTHDHRDDIGVFYYTDLDADYSEADATGENDPD